uniref:Arrestin C-terminal-like domain-containing protein n=1 Tax=Heliothis virescens TaxID=7102 RepID=A0A2A4JQS2_HELVI
MCLCINMGAACQILINRTEEGYFKAGQCVTGTLKYPIDKPTRYDSIDISFVGKGRCHWSETDSQGQTDHFSNEEVYVSIHQNVFTPVGDEMIEPGDYEYPFEFLLPDDIPSSVKSPNCNIQYKVIVKFAKNKTLSSDYEYGTEVPVYGYVKPCYLQIKEPLIFGVVKKLLSFNANNKITVKAEIDRTCVNPGESIHLMITATNDSNVAITIKSELVHCITYLSSGKVPTKKILTATVTGSEETSPTIKENSVTKLARTVQILDTLYSIQNSKIMIGEYKVKVTIQVPFPHINADVQVPVVIGWRREEPESLSYPDEMPPSYSEAINDGTSYVDEYNEKV